MITSTDAAEIIFKDCEPFGIETYLPGNVPTIKGVLEDERIVILAKKQFTTKRWEVCFIEVNFEIPDINGKENGIRLKELERKAKKAFKSVTGVSDDTRYTYGYESIGIEEDSVFCSHFLNIRILFKSLNTL